MFYIAAHLHDIGMNFAGIYKALSDLVAAGGDSALHIGEIIHKYHHYSSFIVLLELNYFDENKKAEAESIGDCPYLLNLHPHDRKQNKHASHIERRQTFRRRVIDPRNLQHQHVRRPGAGGARRPLRRG